MLLGIIRTHQSLGALGRPPRCGYEIARRSNSNQQRSQRQHILKCRLAFSISVSHARIIANRQKQKNSDISEFDKEFGGQGRDRTGDTRIFSPLLYQLSYLATALREMVGAQGFEPWTQ